MIGLTAAEAVHWDAAHAATVRSTDEVHVQVDIDVSDDGTELEVHRRVTRKSHRARDRHILWEGVVAVIPRHQVPGFSADLVHSALAMGGGA